MTPEHGTRSRYLHHQCRCEPCTIANRDYINDWNQRKRDGRAGRLLDTTKDPAGKYVLEIIRWWHDEDGRSLRSIAALCEVTPHTIRRLYGGQARTVRLGTARKIVTAATKEGNA